MEYSIKRSHFASVFVFDKSILPHAFTFKAVK